MSSILYTFHFFTLVDLSTLVDGQVDVKRRGCLKQDSTRGQRSCRGRPRRGRSRRRGKPGCWQASAAGPPRWGSPPETWSKFGRNCFLYRWSSPTRSCLPCPCLCRLKWRQLSPVQTKFKFTLFSQSPTSSLFPSDFSISCLFADAGELICSFSTISCQRTFVDAFFCLRWLSS